MGRIPDPPPLRTTGNHPIRAICSYCDLDLGDREPLDDPRVTHGMCQACFDHFETQWGAERLGEALDRFDAPVVAVNHEGRVIAINSAMAALTSVDARDAVGLRGGEFLECAHARLPERCGQTVHCGACTIRNSVEHTLLTGQPTHRRLATLTTVDGPVRLLISTSRQGDHVRVVIEEREG